MEDNKLMRKELASGARLALIFGIMNTLLNSLVSAIFAGKLNGNLASAIAISIVTVIALLCNRKKLPEGWFCAAKEKMDPRVILSFLGFFALYQLATKLLFRSGSEGLPGNSWSFVLYMGIMVPICEETIFRGIILGKYVKYGRVFALICTSILFGAYHMNLIQLVTGALMGLVFAYVGMRYCIGWCILIHFFNNGLVATILPLLWKASGNSSLISRGTIIVCAIVAAVGLAAFLGSHLIRDIREYFASDPGTKGSCKAVFLNAWFIVLILICIGMTVMVFYMGMNNLV